MKKNLGKYFNYFKRKCDEQEEARTYASTTDGEIEYLMKNKKEKEEFKKDQNFILWNTNLKKILKNNMVFKEGRVTHKLKRSSSSPSSFVNLPFLSRFIFYNRKINL